MCKRKDAVKDPLGKLLFGRYGLHLLSLPRAGIRVGEVFVHGDRDIIGSGDISAMFDPAFQLPTPVLGERAIPLEETQSKGLEAEAGLSLLDKLFNAVGFAGAGEVRAAYRAEKATQLQFKFQAPTRDSVDILAVTDRLFAARPKEHLWKREDERFYLVSAVLRSSGISISATTDNGTTVDVAAKIRPLAEASGKLKVSNGDGSLLTYSGPDPLGFGVELVELFYDAKSKRVDRRQVPAPVNLRAAGFTSDRGLSFIGDEDADLFIDVKDA